jgi:NADPH:quinone reductase-like Zn-dependent oxidoreductase
MGVVTKVGSDVTSFSEGKRVTALLHVCAACVCADRTGMGVVTKVGSDVTSFSEGQRVTALGWMGHEGNGSWQQYINVPADRVVALPDGISDEAGAQFYVSIVSQRDIPKVPTQ